MKNSLSSVLIIFIMIGIGYLLANRGVLNRETNKLFSKLVINISLPLMMIVNIPMRFSKEKLINSLPGIGIATVSMLSVYIIAIILSKIFKIAKEESGIFYGMFTFGNSIFIGLPINISLLGEESAVYVFLYYIASTTLFWTLGIYYIRKSNLNEKSDYSMIQRIKGIFSPPLIGFTVGILLVFLEIELPEFINSSFQYIGSLTTPLSMFFLGTVIYFINFNDIRLDNTTFLIVLGKFLISPLIMIIYLKIFDVTNILNNVFIMLSVTPIVTQIALVSEFYGANSKYVSIMVGFSTILSLFFIPIYAWIFI